MRNERLTVRAPRYLATARLIASGTAAGEANGNSGGNEKTTKRRASSRYFNDNNISSHMSQSSISRNWRKMRLIQARNSSSIRAGSETGVVRQKWANEKLCWSTSVFNEAPSTGISRETDTALSFGNAAQ